MDESKGLETVYGMNFNQYQPKFAPRTVANERDVRELALKENFGRSVTIVCPKVQVLSSHLSGVDDLLAEHKAKKVYGKYFNCNLCPIHVMC